MNSPMTSHATALTRVALTALILSLAGCGLFGPDRNPPAMPSPDHYSVEGQPAQLPGAEGVAQHLEIGARPVPEWWKGYQSDALNALVEEGLANSPSLGAAQNTLKAAREGLRSQIGDSLFPHLDVGFSPTRERALGIPILPQEPTFLENVFVAQIQASYTFDFFGAALLADRALAGQVQQQAFQLESTRRALAANIVVATINAAALQEQVDATEKLVELGEQRARQTAARYQLGSASRDDMLSAEQDAANAAATLPGLRAQALAVRHAQAVLLGRTPDQAAVPLSLDALHVPESVPVAIPTELLHQRPDILAAEAVVRATADQAGAATASMFPSLTLSASYGRGGFDWATFTSPAGLIWGVGATLSQPLFHGGALVARKHQYEATHDAAVSQYKQTVLSAFQTVADTLVSLDEDANTLNQTRRAMNAAHDASSDTESRYKLGATPFYATLTAGQQYQSARVQYVRARAARLADTATLFDSMGNPPVDYEGTSLRNTVAPTQGANDAKSEKAANTVNTVNTVNTAAE
ncbi:efflux transporter outer membrane subunit [Pararobbsia alpina]|uniref:Antibiotic efflux pump outer membrane protein ArpC n=1 Tax=Pararobbsia alpina TaxID=621374 RepID=A0A6S7BP34_9BURK|nr:efflux transporter outer membrane subunit [Pararobbsia alpina]CAB3791417.1 Antibiotic efflux pump outer membrane protein ArpC [Pararobbsia alpina]